MPVFLAGGAVGQKEAPPLPEDKIVVDIDAPTEDVFQIGIPNLLGVPNQLCGVGRPNPSERLSD